MEKEKKSEFVFADDLMSRFGLNQRIIFYLKTDPKFFFEYKKLNLESRTGELTPRKRQTKLGLLISGAEKRKLAFMIDALKEDAPKGVTVEELLEEYTKESKRYLEELETISKKVKEKDLLELVDNPDYQSMQKKFDEMKKKKSKEKK